MSVELCPLLGTLDDSNTPCPPVEYPSFENHCLVSDDRDTLLLADQASYCLSGGHRVCPRYQVAAAARNGTRVDARVAADLMGGALASDQLRPELMAAALEGDEKASRRRWAWMGTGALFIMVMLCGSVFAVYSGWQQVQDFLVQREAGNVSSIASMGVGQQYVIVTAVPDGGEIALNQPDAESLQDANAQGAVVQDPALQQGAAQPLAQPDAAQQAFPPAVTATPGGPPLLPETSQQTQPQAPAAEPPVVVVDPGNQAPIIPVQEPPNILLEVPTRRPTPEFDIPTSTPALETPTNTPTITPTPTPVGTPVVVFGPAQQLVPNGECTIVSWSVENVREVYYENIGVDGRGQKEECVDDMLEVYRLVVVLPDGSSKLYTTTVTMLMPTHTPEPTATFTPVVEPTATWTPMPPTATPTPAVTYNVVVNVEGSTQQKCAAGATCEIGFIVLNTGSAVDSLLVNLVGVGPWRAELCRTDGVCASSNLALAAMGPGNTAHIALRLTLPADATGGGSYGVSALSSGSNGTVTSGVTTVDVSVE